MKRDWQLIRHILLKIEQEPQIAAFSASCLPNYPALQVDYHIWLLLQSGLVVGQCTTDTPDNQTFQCFAVCLTWRGHEFLSQIREETVWLKVRQTIAEKSLDLGLETIKATAAALIAKSIV